MYERRDGHGEVGEAARSPRSNREAAFQSRVVYPSLPKTHAATDEEKDVKAGNVLWTEFSSSNVYRRFELPNPIDVDKVTAKLKKGILQIHAPKIVRAEEVTAKAA